MKKYIISLLAVLVLFSCVSSGTIDVQEGFVDFTLDNGIPVFIKQINSNRVNTIELYFEDNSLYAEEDKAGLEFMTVNMLTKGSENYSYEDIQQIGYEKSSSMGVSAGWLDFSAVTLTTLDKYFDELFEVYADAIKNPSWNEEQFQILLSDTLKAKQEDMFDFEAYGTDILNEKFFSGHPYGIDTKGTMESLQSISIEDLNKYHSNLVSADRMFFVAVGNFKPNELKEKLNNAFGAIESQNNEKKELFSHFEQDNSAVIIEPFDEVQGVCYVRGNYALPDVTSDESITFQLAVQILDDLLFEVARTRNSSCYSVYSAQFAYIANYGKIEVLKTNQPENIKRYIDQAIAYLANGKSMSAEISTATEGQVEEDESSIVSLDESLEFYKNKFLTQYYMRQQTNNSITFQMARSYIASGDYKNYQSFMNKVNAITSAEIVDVVNKYLVNGKFTWVVVGPTEMVESIDTTVYESFTE